MDLGQYRLSSGSNYDYSPVDPSKSKLPGLMTTDYDQLKKNLQTPGDIQINDTFDKSDYRMRDIMGGNGLYGSSIQSDAMNDSAYKRSNALALNAANAGATTEQLKSANNQWLGNALLDENNMFNTWNLDQERLNRALEHDIILANLNNDAALKQIDKQGEWGMNQSRLTADANDNAAMWGGLGGLGGSLLGSNWFGDLF